MPSTASARQDALLNEVIALRKMEARRVAREKLKEDREKIQTMMTSQKNGVEPEMIFPKEIWQCILGELTSPEDIVNASETCPLFKKLLRRKRCAKVLFPAVLEIMNPTFETLDQFRKIRLVCKSWKDGFDDLAKKLEEKEAFGLRSNSRSTILVPDLGPEDVPNKTRLKGLLKMSTSQRVLGINLQLEREGLAEVSKPQIMEFCGRTLAQLKSKGRDLRTFYFSANLDNLKDAGLTYGRLYGFLRKCLSLTPRLTRLGLLLAMGPESEDNEEQIRKFKRAQNKHGRLPRLRSLEKLYLRLDHGLNESTTVFEDFVKANPQVKDLSMATCEHSWNERRRLKRAIRALPLKSLSVATCHFGKRGLVDLINAGWKLESLTLNCNLAPKIDLNLLFPALKRFPLLKHLELDFSSGTFGDVFPILKLPRSDSTDAGLLHLPNVTNLALHLPDRYMGWNIDFIFPLAKLENLTVTYVKPSDRDSDDTDESTDYEYDYDDRGQFENFGANKPLFQLNGRSNLNENSRVWEIFPFLKKATIRKVDEIAENILKERVFFRGAKSTSDDN